MLKNFENKVQSSQGQNKFDQDATALSLKKALEKIDQMKVTETKLFEQNKKLANRIAKLDEENYC